MSHVVVVVVVGGVHNQGGVVRSCAGKGSKDASVFSSKLLKSEMRRAREDNRKECLFFVTKSFYWLL